MEPEKGYDENYFNGLLSEKVTYQGGKWKWEKLPGHMRNEALDCRNYANAGYKVLRPNLDRLYQQINNISISDEKRPAVRKQQKRRTQAEDDW